MLYEFNNPVQLNENLNWDKILHCSQMQDKINAIMLHSSSQPDQ